MPTVSVMDPAKAEFLFGDIPDDIDLDDPDQRADLFALDDDGPLSGARSAMRALVAEQIINDDPPAVWATAQRLQDLGMDRGRAMAELAMALGHTAQAALGGADPDADPDPGLDAGAYEAALESLPLPTPAQIEEAALAIVAGGAPVSAEDLDAGVLARLGRAATDALAVLIVDRVLDRLMDDDGPIAMLAGDQVVDVGALTAAIVLTHRLTQAEHDGDLLALDFDLAGFARRGDPQLADGWPLLPATDAADDADTLAWQGPAGWLRGYEPGTLLAVRADPAGLVSLDALAEEPPLEAELVDRLRAAYDDAVAEPWLPVRRRTSSSVSSSVTPKHSTVPGRHSLTSAPPPAWSGGAGMWPTTTACGPPSAGSGGSTGSSTPSSPTTRVAAAPSSACSRPPRPTIPPPRTSAGPWRISGTPPWSRLSSTNWARGRAPSASVRPCSPRPPPPARSASPAGWRPSPPSAPAPVTWRWLRRISTWAWRPTPPQRRWWNAVPGTPRTGAGHARR